MPTDVDKTHVINMNQTTFKSQIINELYNKLRKQGPINIEIE